MDFKSFIRAQDAVGSGKAIPAHPALLDPNLHTSYTPGPARVRTPFGQREASRHLQAYGGQNDAIDWVMNCVRLIVETASNADWHFEKDGERYYTKKGKDIPVDAKEAPLMLAKLFDDPNPYMALEELIELTLIDYLLVGNAYWLKWRTNDAGQPLALYRLAPPFVKVIPGQFGIEGYTYEIPGVKDKLKLSPDQVMHFRQANPHSAYYGLGVISGGSRMLDLELALTDTQASYFEKRAQPSMVVQSDRRVPKDVFKRMQNQLRQMYGGPRNAGALMVLESGLKYQSIAPSAQDAQFENLSKMSRDRIMAMFRVPGSLLGIHEGSSDGNNNQDQRIFDTKTMRPLLNKFESAISKGITSAWDMDFIVDYDYIMPVEDRIRLTSAFAAIPGVRLREVREYAGLPPLGDPELDELVLNLPGEDGEEGDERKGIPDNNLSGEAGRPPKPGNTQAFPKDGSIPDGAAVRRTSLAAADNKKAVISEEDTPEGIEEILARFAEVEARKAMESSFPGDLASKITPPDDVLQIDRDAAIDTLVADLKDEIKDAVHTLERGLLDELQDAVEGKAPGDRIRSRIRNSEAWKTFMATFSASLERASRSALGTAVLQQTRLGHEPTEEIDYDALVKEIVYRSGGVRKITQNLKSEVAQKVAKALKEGGSRQDIDLAIREAIDFWRESHAETVAMTEAVHAYNEGTITVAELTGHTHVYVHDGDQHDEPCIEANGQVWELDFAREHRLEHPRCRRGFTPVSI